MRFITLFSGALVATTAVNILLPSDAHAGYPPSGWSQVGKSCGNKPSPNNSDTYYLLQKNGQSSKWGVYRNKKTWQGNIKGVSEKRAKAKMNDMCNCIYVRPSDGRHVNNYNDNENGGCVYKPYSGDNKWSGN